jgi:hypothetical protein
MSDDTESNELDELYTAFVTAVLNADLALLNELLEGLTLGTARSLAMVGVMNAVEAVMVVAEAMEEDPLELWQRSLLEGDAFEF